MARSTLIRVFTKTKVIVVLDRVPCWVRGVGKRLSGKRIFLKSGLSKLSKEIP